VFLWGTSRTARKMGGKFKLDSRCLCDSSNVNFRLFNFRCRKILYRYKSGRKLLPITTLLYCHLNATCAELARQRLAENLNSPSHVGLARVGGEPGGSTANAKLTKLTIIFFMMCPTSSLLCFGWFGLWRGLGARRRLRMGMSEWNVLRVGSARRRLKGIGRDGKIELPVGEQQTVA
jgi:hypothetical protein